MTLCFQYAITVVSNPKNIAKDLQRISKIKPFTDQDNWREISFPSHTKKSKKFETYNKTIALNILYVPDNSKEIRYTYISKHNLTHKNRIIILIITDDEK